jgi:hypothetical protein
MNPWSPIGFLFLSLALSGCSPDQAGNPEQTRPIENVTNVLGTKLEAVHLELKAAFDLVPKVPIEEQNLYLEKGLSALFHYGNMIAIADNNVENLITMEEMAAVIPEGPQKERVLDRMANAYRSTSDSLMLPHLVGQDFEKAGQLKDNDALRNTVEKVEATRSAFMVILEERRPLIDKSVQRKQREMYNELDELARSLREAREGKPDKK